MHCMPRNIMLVMVGLVACLAIANCRHKEIIRTAVVTSVDPSSCVEINSVLTVKGAYFEEADIFSVLMEDVTLADRTILSDSILTVTVTGYATPGSKTLTIHSTGGVDIYEPINIIEPLTVTSIDPDTGSECGFTEVTITGENFDNSWVTVAPDDTPFFRDWELFTDDPTEGMDKIVGTTAAHDPGTYAVTVWSSWDECVHSGSLDFTYTQAECAESVSIETLDAGAQVVGIGDFNSDGNNDVIVAHYDAVTARVFHGNGVGGFSDWYDIIMNSSDHPVALVVADFNNDDKDDVAIAVHGSNQVNILLQSVSDALELQSLDHDIGGTPEGIAAAHVNGDEFLDIAVAMATTEVRYILGIGFGMFRSADIPPTPLSTPPTDIVAGAPKSNGVSDFFLPLTLDESVVALFNESTVDSLLITPNNRNVSQQVRRIAYHDVLSDHPGGEVIAISPYSATATLTILADYTGGTPGHVEQHGVGSDGGFVAGGKFRAGADGQIAVIYQSLAKQMLLIFPQPPDFEKSFGAALSGYPNSIATGDLDGDGYDDIVVGLISGTIFDVILSGY